MKGEINISNEKVQLFYMVFGCVFAYGCVWFGATNDPFYDTDEYRADGGDGTQNWWYGMVRTYPPLTTRHCNGDESSSCKLGA